MGGGPAGLSTALSLLKLAPSVKDDLIVLEKASYPRDKVCAGGLIRRALDHLEALGISLNIPYVRVDCASLVFPPAEAFTIESSGQGVVISRRDFDALLARELKSRGVRVLEGVRVLSLQRRPGGVDDRWEPHRRGVVERLSGRRHLPVRKRCGRHPPLRRPRVQRRRYQFPGLQ